MILPVAYSLTKLSRQSLPTGSRIVQSMLTSFCIHKDNDAVLKKLVSRISSLIVAESNARVRRQGLNEIGVPVKSPNRRYLRSGGQYLFGANTGLITQITYTDLRP